MSQPYKSTVEEGLCFCEYNDINGHRNHMLACCCDCEAVDMAFDRCVTCHQIPDETVKKLCSTVEDRCRMPWRGGAVRMRLDIVLPASLVPCSVLIATLGPIWTFLAFLGLFSCLMLFFRFWLWRPVRRKTHGFFVFSLTSVFQLFITYITVVVGFREVLLWETLLLSTMFTISIFFLLRLRQNMGAITSPGDSRLRMHRAKTSLEDDSMLAEHEVTWIDSRSIINGRLVTWCEICKVQQPPRSSHCDLCGVCVAGRDHHCIWIDACIGNSNHKDFMVTLLCLVATGLYGAHLTMTTICTPEMYFDWFLWPNDCRFIYADFPTALSFVSACYIYAGVAFIVCVLIQQLVLISQNVTLVEFRRAASRGWKVSGWLPLIVQRRHNFNDRGFCRNWYDFISDSRQQQYLVLSSVV